MRVCVLGSSSSGNAIFLADGRTRVLIDTGNLPIFRFIQPALAGIGEDWLALDAILISHAHGDHLNSNTFSIAHRTGTPVYVAEPVRQWLGEAPYRFAWPFLDRCQAAGMVRTLDGDFRVGGLEVTTCRLPHDVDPTLGFVVAGRRGARVGVATDLGHCPPPVVRRLRDCDVLIFEANHDEVMERESDRDIDLVERNLGPRGHLSNGQSAAALCEIVGGSRRPPRCVFLAHISQECNRPDLACATVKQALAGHGWRDVAVEATFPRRPSVVAHLGRGS